MVIEKKPIRNNVLGIPDRAALNASLVDGLDVPQIPFQVVHNIEKS